MVRDAYKLIADIFKDEVYFELYDTASDPQETRNLLFEESVPVLARSMLQSLLEHMKATHDDIHIPLTDLDAFVENYRDLAAKQGVCI